MISLTKLKAFIMGYSIIFNFLLIREDLLSNERKSWFSLILFRPAKLSSITGTTVTKS